MKKIWTSVLIAAFLIPTFLFGICHQMGTLSLMNYLAAEAQNQPHKSSFVFLMPCHSTPMYSHLHVNVTTRFLQCEPPLTSNPYDEADDFFSDPEDWLRKFWSELNSPSHVACFDAVAPVIETFLKEQGFVEEKVFFHTIFSEGRIGRYVNVYKKQVI